MSERKSARDRLLDALVFVPVGLAVTAAEELPKLAAKGRQRVEGQVATARVVGQFAVQMGRREVQRRLERRHAPSSGAPDRAAGPPDTAPHGREPAPPAPEPVATQGATGVGDMPAERGDGPAGNGSARRAPQLAIPGYDTLSASQVVQRLDGLSPVELVAVRDHEASHRHRRTILHRVDQLLASSDGR